MFTAPKAISPGSKASPSTTIRSSIGYGKQSITPQKSPLEDPSEQPTPTTTRARLPPETFGDEPKAPSTSDEQHLVSGNGSDGDDGDEDRNLFFGYDAYKYDQDAAGSAYPDDQQLQREESDEQPLRTRSTHSSIPSHSGPLKKKIATNESKESGSPWSTRSKISKNESKDHDLSDLRSPRTNPESLNPAMASSKSQEARM